MYTAGRMRDLGYFLRAALALLRVCITRVREESDGQSPGDPVLSGSSDERWVDTLYCPVFERV